MVLDFSWPPLSLSPGTKIFSARTDANNCRSCSDNSLCDLPGRSRHRCDTCGAPLTPVFPSLCHKLWLGVETVKHSGWFAMSWSCLKLLAIEDSVSEERQFERRCNPAPPAWSRPIAPRFCRFSPFELVCSKSYHGNYLCMRPFHFHVRIRVRAQCTFC